MLLTDSRIEGNQSINTSYYPKIIGKYIKTAINTTNNGKIGYNHGFDYRRTFVTRGVSASEELC